MEEELLTPDTSPESHNFHLPSTLINTNTNNTITITTIESLTRELNLQKNRLQFNHSELTSTYTEITRLKNLIDENDFSIVSKKQQKQQDEYLKKEKVESNLNSKTPITTNSSTNTTTTSSTITGPRTIPHTFIKMNLERAFEVLGLQGDENELELWQLYEDLVKDIEPDEMKYKEIRGAMITLSSTKSRSNRLRTALDQSILDEITAHMNWLLFYSDPSSSPPPPSKNNTSPGIREKGRGGFDITEFLVEEDIRTTNRYCKIEGRPTSFEVVELNEAFEFLKVEENCSNEQLLFSIGSSQIEHSDTPFKSNGAILTACLSRTNIQPFREYVESIIIEEVESYFNTLHLPKGLKTSNFLELYTAGVIALSIAEVDTEEEAFSILNISEDSNIQEIFQAWEHANQRQSDTENYYATGAIFRLSTLEEFNEDLLPILRDILVQEMNHYFQILPTPRFPIPTSAIDGIMDELDYLVEHGGIYTELRLKTEINNKMLQIATIQEALTRPCFPTTATSSSSHTYSHSNRNLSSNSKHLSLSKLQLETCKKKIQTVSKLILSLEKTLISLVGESKKRKLRDEKAQKLRDRNQVEKVEMIDEEVQYYFVVEKKPPPSDIQSAKIVPQVKLLAEKLTLQTIKTALAVKKLNFRIDNPDKEFPVESSKAKTKVN